MAIAIKVDLVSPGSPKVRVMDEVFDKDEISVGRSPTNDIVLARPEVSGSHARLLLETGNGGAPTISVLDLGSSNGTYIEDKQVPAGELCELGSEQRVVIGSFLITPIAKPAAAKPAGPKMGTQVGEATPPQGVRQPKIEKAAEAPSADDPDRFEEEFRIRRTIHEQLIERLDLRRRDIVELSDEDLRGRARKVVERVLIDLRWEIPEGLERETLIRQVLDEALGLGPLEELLADDDCSEIMVNSYKQIYAERGGKLKLTDYRFSGEQAVLAAIERILAPIGRRIDESSPMVDARLQDGSRVNAVIRPLALQGPCITIRKFAKDPLTVEDLIRFGAVSRGIAEFLQLAVANRRNVVISGGTGSGKTTLLNIISGFIPNGERVITAEDAAELKLPQEHVVSFETRPPNLEGKGAVTIRDLVRNALRMRPDRIIVGECRGSEALDMLQAMNTGHDGSMTTGHANAPADMIRRLETMVLTGGLDLPIRAVREQIGSAIDLVIQQTRFGCGSRKITAVTEIVGMDYEEGIVQLEDIFTFVEEGYGEDGKIQGYHQATGYVPKFFRNMQQRGLSVSADVFSPGKQD